MVLASSQKRKSGMAFGSLLFGKGIYRCEFREGNEGMCQMNISNPFLLFLYSPFLVLTWYTGREGGSRRQDFQLFRPTTSGPRKASSFPPPPRGVSHMSDTTKEQEQKRDVLLLFSGKLEQQGNKNGIARKGKVVRFLGG